jgi:hypothetical protein
MPWHRTVVRLRARVAELEDVVRAQGAAAEQERARRRTACVECVRLRGLLAGERLTVARLTRRLDDARPAPAAVPDRPLTYSCGQHDLHRQLAAASDEAQRLRHGRDWYAGELERAQGAYGPMRHAGPYTLADDEPEAEPSKTGS